MNLCAGELFIDKSHAHLDQVVLALETNVTDIVSCSFRDAVDNTNYSRQSLWVGYRGSHVLRIGFPSQPSTSGLFCACD